MGCPSLNVWALIAAAYTTGESFGFLVLNILMILMHADVYQVSTGFFGSISLYTEPDNGSNNCTAPEGRVSTGSVIGYQYAFIVFHVLWIISGLVILSQLCRKTRSLWDYIMWMAVAVILLLLDTITGIFFIVDRAGMDSGNNDCLKAAFSMILLSFRWFLFFIINIACVVVVALVMRRPNGEAREPANNYMDQTSTRKRLQSDNLGIGPPEARSRKPPAALPTETIEENDENKFIGEQMQMESEVPNPFDTGDQEAPTDNVPHTSFQTHSPTQVQQGSYLPQTIPNLQELPLDQHGYSMPDPQSQMGDEHNKLTAQNSLDSRIDNPIPQERQYSVSYMAAGRPWHDPRRSMEQDEQRLERFGLHSERQGDFARSQFDDEQRHMHHPQSRHAYDNQAYPNDAPYEEDNFPHEAPGPHGGQRPPPRTKRNGSNRRKRVAPQPIEIPTEDSIEEEEEEEPKTPKVASLSPTASFDPRPFSYLNPTFRPTDHADVKAMKTHTADIVKTLDQETKQLKEKEKLSEGSDSDAKGVISSTLVRNYLNDSGRMKDAKRSTSLREQLSRSGKAAARQQSFNKPSPNRPNAHRDLGSIEESNSNDPVAEAKPHRRRTGDSATSGRTAVNRDGQRRPYEDRGEQRRPHNDRELNRKHARRDQTDDVNEDDYDSSDYDDEEEYHKKPVFMTEV